MKNTSHLWQQTAAQCISSYFTNDMSANISRLHSPQELLYAQENIPYVLWRWMHLEQPLFHKNTPSLFLEGISSVEHWSDTGQFLLTASLAFPGQTIPSNNPHVDITTTMDFIEFAQQPLVVDIQNMRHKITQRYPWGSPYTEITNQLFKTMAPLMRRGLTDLELAYATCYAAIRYNLLCWYETRPYLHTAFLTDEWFEFWHQQFRAMHTSEGLSTDALLDSYTKTMRNALPDFSFTTDELKRYKPGHGSSPSHKFMEQYDFWIGFGSSVLIPLSLYVNLVEPIYTDTENFIDDMMMLLTHPLSAYASHIGPCTHMFLTRFGQLFFASYDSGFYKEVAV